MAVLCDEEADAIEEILTPAADAPKKDRLAPKDAIAVTQKLYEVRRDALVLRGAREDDLGEALERVKELENKVASLERARDQLQLEADALRLTVKGFGDG